MTQRRQLESVLKGRVLVRLEAGQAKTTVSRALNVPQKSFPSVDDGSKKQEVFIGYMYRSPMGRNAAKGLIFDQNSMTRAEDVCRRLRCSSFEANCIPETQGSQSLCQTSNSVRPTH